MNQMFSKTNLTSCLYSQNINRFLNFAKSLVTGPKKYKEIIKPVFYLSPPKRFIEPVLSTRKRDFSAHQKNIQLKTHSCGSLCLEDVGKTVILRGFLQYQRMGIFCLLRDSFGVIQVVVNTDTMASILKETSYESYIQVTGEVVCRPDNQINKSLKTGEIEVMATELTVLSQAKKDLPFLIRKHNQPQEQLGLKHRYLNLRYQYLQDNLRARSQIGKKMRDYLQDVENFVEITTPTLSVNTPGGSQEFVVPSQAGKGNLFYSLVQSPQTYKQLAVIGGVERYFQFALCYRDEGGKPDRQPEFMQLDLEMSDTTASGVRFLVEELLVQSWPPPWEGKEGAPGPPPRTPFPVITYQQAMDEYGVDKPDMRFDWKLVDVTETLVGAESSLFVAGEGRRGKAFLVPGGESHVKKADVSAWQDVAQREASLPGAVVLSVKGDGATLKGKAAKALPPVAAARLIRHMDAAPGDMIVLAFGPEDRVLKLLGKLRLLAADLLEVQGGVAVRDPSAFAFVWVVDFPLFERDESTGGLAACHHPFTAPRSDHVHLIHEDPLQATSEHYDLVLNGSEIAGGSLRIHDAAVQRQVLAALGIEHGALHFLLDALECGAPPHGGIALGFDRYVCLLRGAKSIRDVMAFPKSNDGRCLMSGAPAALSEHDRRLYGLK